MITNPSTLGIFEQRIPEIAKILHDKGALLYMDGANMNALAGVTRPGDLGVDVMHLNLHKTFSTPHGGGGPGAGPVAMKKILEPFRPVPILVEKEGGRLALESVRPDSIGRVKAFSGNFGVLVRALAYILAYGPGIRQATKTLSLTRITFARTSKVFTSCLIPCPRCTKSCSATPPKEERRQHHGYRQAPNRLRLPSIHHCFPLIVPGALMIEPTESESKEECDLFIDAMRSIAEEAATNPDLVKTAPHSTRVRRLDEVGAARKPILRWDPARQDSEPNAAKHKAKHKHLEPTPVIPTA